MPDLSNLSDSQLIANYLAGDQNALDILIARHLKFVYGFVYQYVNNIHDAEDIAQETFIKVWKNLKKFKTDKNFKTWLLSIAKNASFDFLRKKRPWLFSELDKDDEENSFIDSLTDPAPLPPEIFYQQNLAQTLAAAMEKLPTKDRLILFLHYQDELTFQEIGETLKEPLNTVKSRHRRALIALKKLLASP